MKTISLNPGATGEVFTHNFNKVIGSGHLGLALYERTLKHLEMAHRDLGVEYLRCHGLLSGSPDLCSWANQSNAGLNPELGFDKDQLAGEGDVMANYAFIDLIIDRLLDIGIRPFVEIGFMPRILASSRHTLMRWDAYTSPPRDYGLWTELIEGLMRHWVKRYGKQEMLNWYYEVWNEPNQEKNAVMLVESVPVEDHRAEYYELDTDFYDSLSLLEEPQQSEPLPDSHDRHQFTRARMGTPIHVGTESRFNDTPAHARSV